MPAESTAFPSPLARGEGQDEGCRRVVSDHWDLSGNWELVINSLLSRRPPLPFGEKKVRSTKTLSSNSPSPLRGEGWGEGRVKKPRLFGAVLLSLLPAAKTYTFHPTPSHPARP